MSAQSDIGPKAPTRMEVCLLATDVIRMAQQARELCGRGPGLDVPRAVQILGKVHALLSEIVTDGDD